MAPVANLMKKIWLSICSILLIFTLAVPSFAAEKVPTIDKGRDGQITIDYKEDTDGKDSVAGAEFTYYKVADIGDSGEYIPIIDGIENLIYEENAEAVLAAAKEAYSSKELETGKIVYEAVTDSNGMAVTSGMDQGLYVAEESKPAIEHFASIPFLFSLPYTENNVWNYEITAEPKSLPAGDLIVEKTLSGNNVEKNREFHFRITLDYDDEVHYVKSDGTFGYIKSGDTISLKGGQSVTLDTIPVGCSYKVTEVEADKDGYATTSTGATGNIVQTEPQTAAFVNSRNLTGTAGNVNTNDPNTLYFAGGICLIFLLLSVMIAKKRYSLS